MVPGLLAWGGMYALFLLAFPFLSTPQRPLHGYLLFEACALFPWFAWLFWTGWRRGPVAGMSLVIQACLVLVLSFPVQILATRRMCWTYFQDKDTLLGPTLGGVPAEEFLFYPLTVNVSVLIYLWVCDWLKAHKRADLGLSRSMLNTILVGAAVLFYALAAYVWTLRDATSVVAATRSWDASGVAWYAEGPRLYEWTLVCLASAATNLLIFRFGLLRGVLNLRAVLLTAPIFILICVLVDLLGVSRGWWVYNAQQVSRLWIGGIVAESVPMYATGVMLPLSLYGLIRNQLGARGYA